jgi:hypothetical protein
MSAEDQFEQWWTDEGSGIPPLKNEDAETHVRRVARIAWMKARELVRFRPPLHPPQDDTQ